MIEAGVVIEFSGEASRHFGIPVYWHHPVGRTSGALPDSQQLWQVLWDCSRTRRLLGFAHTHPGSGIPGPSYTDLTTFAAVEAGLGQRLVWWILSSDCAVELIWQGPNRLDYQAVRLETEPPWAAGLRALSKIQQTTKET